jgi:chloramphenicol 3-O phosphotransferase
VIVVLNGAPRSGKSSIAAEIQRTFQGTWMNLGVDVARLTTPPSAQPGIGLRPGEDEHPAAKLVPVLYAALWESVAAHVRLGLDVVVDVGLYDPEIAADAAQRLSGLDVLFVGVRCPIGVNLERRRQGGAYATTREPAERWEREVHKHWPYDIELDTSTLSPEGCADAIARRLEAEQPPSAFARLATFRA